MLSLSKSQFISKSEKYNLIPLYIDLSSDIFTPSNVFAAFKSNSYAYLLESVEPDEQIGRFSFIGFGALRLLKGVDKDPLEDIQMAFARIKACPQDKSFPFEGGFVGYINYDVVRNYEPVRIESLPLYPESMFVLSKNLISFDNLEGKMRIATFISTDGLSRKELEDAYQQARKGLWAILKIIQRRFPRFSPIPYDFSEDKKRLVKSGLKGVKSSFTQKRFYSAVEKIKDYICDGEIIQAVLSQRLELTAKADPFDVYRVLRLINPSPYMFCLKFGPQRLYAVGASPEMLIRVSGREVETHPIAGTRWRGKTRREDELLARELLGDEKERAEHVMLVDLGRNDLGRVCLPGSVKVEKFMYIQNFSHVMHIVSKVSGRLARGRTAFDAFRAAFPAGTVTGAPKIRAMEVIEELEPVPRGMYAGSVGYFDFSGNMDMCITIRTIIFHKTNAYVQAGAGIVADSQASKEYRETLNKAAAQIFAIKLAEKLKKTDKKQGGR